MPHITNAGRGPLQVPGFGGIPLNFELSPETRFAHGLLEYRHSPRLTKREIAMLRLMQHITETPGWHRAILDPDENQLARWHRDAVEGPEGFLITALAWGWCISELRDKARTWQATGRLLVFDSSSAVCQSNELGVSLEDIQKQVTQLGPQINNYSPLVDPFLYPLAYARSPVLSSGGEVPLHDLWCSTGEVDKGLPLHPFNQLQFPFDHLRRRIPLDRQPGYGGPESCYSNHFQWLPFEVTFSSNDPLDVSITSYVNNLHPQNHRNLYAHLEDLVARSVSSWNEVLFYGNSRGRHPPRILTYGCHIHNYMEERKIFRDIVPLLNWRGICDTHEDWQKLCDNAREYISGPEPPKWQQAEPRSGRSPNLLDELTPEQWENPRLVSQLTRSKRARRAWFNHPEPGVSFSYEQWKEGKFTGRAIIPQRVGKFPDPLHHQYTPVRLQDTFREQGLQVVVEIFNIELTPESPTYSGEAHFHIEGLRNDRIAATSLFVVETKNITEPRISFQHEDKVHASELECKVPNTLANVLDIDSFKLFEEQAPEALHTFGSVPLTKGHLLSWPNTFRSKQESFRLADPSQPGNLTGIKLRLVDPHYRICSTRNVPPQQHDWWATSAQQAAHLDRRLPAELVQLVMNQTEQWPVSRAKAERLCQELHLDHERVRMVIDECVGHHIVGCIPFDDPQDVRVASGLGYESP
ncbi:uncharacterized protein N7482_007958 [Penicillium canariense]|uniref:Uncharacterized protein n=1 Tax=Penicillium canariense TaxID=189055 RepID=A0A9W9LKM6_9EURO|nr:uncharacterized protein N7482_007958 [Penicillium canariense]KAJ5160954.1 hypothetical protein N7482_007958 [Penicillium canariense]